MPLLIVQGDPALWPATPSHTNVGIDASGNIAIKQPDGTVQTILPGGTAISEHEQTNNTGDSTVAITNAIHTEVINFTGLSGTRRVSALTSGASAGCRMTIQMLFNNSQPILVSVYNASTSGTLLYSFTTDGTQPNAAYELYYNGAAWKILRIQIPAFI